MARRCSTWAGGSGVAAAGAGRGGGGRVEGQMARTGAAGSGPADGAVDLHAVPSSRSASSVVGGRPGLTAALGAADETRLSRD